MKTIKVVLLIFATLWSFESTAQYYQSKNNSNTSSQSELGNNFWDRVHFGGNLSLQFGDATAIYVSPVAYYELNKQLMVGLGLNYVYIKQNFVNTQFKFSVYGPKALVLFKPLDFMLISSEFEHNYINRNFDFYGVPTDPYWKSALFVGAAYVVPLGENSQMVVGMSFDLLFDEAKSYYASPWRPSVGFYF